MGCSSTKSNLHLAQRTQVRPGTTVCVAILAPPLGDTVQSIFFVFPKPSKTVNSLYGDQTPVPVNLPILNPAF